ncbi:melanoma-associated antigen 10-like [Choloepus didactylus]|uniref:melanoma-associated antigen 10-like n=1 Tax=Choloepus didactylus TaxID=27675 RepID=UPI0018A060B2|nr:melanoma-associated antigen 10-like [Choloepus didactylus]
MPRGQKSQRCQLEEGLQAQSETRAWWAHRFRGLRGRLLYSSSSSSSSSSCSFLVPGNTEEVPAAGTPRPPQSPQGARSSPAAPAAAPSSPSGEGSSRPEEEGPSTSQAQPDAESLLRDAISDNVADLVKFLLLKFRIKEPVTRTEMLSVVMENYKEHFPVIFREAFECLQLVFGIDLKELDPDGQCHVLVSTLGLTHDGMSDHQDVPKTGLLVNVLSMIFMEGTCTPEEEIWKALNGMGVHVGREHFIYGEPRKLLTRDWVRAKYLEYRRVPGSDPVRYEFLWGPRAHAETSKMRVLEFVARVNGTVPSAFPAWYEEALRDEEERARARSGTARDGSAARASVSPRAPCSRFPHPEGSLRLRRPSGVEGGSQ